MTGSDVPPGDVQQRLDTLEQQVVTLSETVQELAIAAAHLAKKDQQHPPISDPTARPEPIDNDELTAWVHWLVVRYELDDIPECWGQHGAFIEELEALRIGWLSTAGQGTVGMAAMQWHDLAGRAFDRLRGIYRTCTDGTHRPWTPPPWVNRDL